MDPTEKKPNYYVRTLIALFCALIVSMIAYRYVWVEPRGEISVGIITLLCLILILVLAESFDSFSVGKLISVSREVSLSDFLCLRHIMTPRSQYAEKTQATCQGDHHP